ncbi:DNA adenine methylase [Saccharolobus caldissimus]|uniref:site-specific DNA-methyltransferase (adenine-specific) n=1 Tax=Saccharolobus caldissimus TaxID=1702097 RepID=A0AAQ4CWU9_9CREN|nr:DNA adenine methylase [Saccharolobus caldissimus]BDC00281.1 restriction endonuclease subunit M [Saccharolobus caldissimus]
MKVVCPICGQIGYLISEKRGNYRYNYVIHIYQEDGKIKKKKHYAGKDINELRKEIEKLIDNKNVRKIISYAGGDYYIADELLKRINAACSDRCTFVEVFGGSGYLSQSVDRKKFTNIIYNDINDKLVTFYKITKENPEKLALLLALLPYGRSYYKIVRELLNNNKNLAELEAAALLFYGINSSFFGGYARKGFAFSVEPGKNAAKVFRKHARGILDLVEKWKDVTIENLDFRDVIKMYDSEKTIFYLDPPYPDRAEDYYGISFTIDDLRDMAKILTQIKGKFLLKIDDKTYIFIQDILKGDKYRVERIERVLNMDKRRGENRRKWILVLISNFT